LAVLASLLVALVVTPALALLLLPSAGTAREPPLAHWLQRKYERLLRGLDRMWLAGALAMVAALVLSVYALSRCGGAFLPDLKETHFVVHARGLPGTSLHDSLATGKMMTKNL